MSKLERNLKSTQSLEPRSTILLKTAQVARSYSLSTELWLLVTVCEKWRYSFVKKDKDGTSTSSRNSSKTTGCNTRYHWGVAENARIWIVCHSVSLQNRLLLHATTGGSTHCPTVLYVCGGAGLLLRHAAIPSCLWVFSSMALWYVRSWNGMWVPCTVTLRLLTTESRAEKSCFNCICFLFEI